MKKILWVVLIIAIAFFSYSFFKKDKVTVSKTINVSEMPEYLKEMASGVNELEVLVVKYEKLMKGATLEEKKKLGMEFQAEIMFSGIMEKTSTVDVDPKDMKIAEDLINKLQDLGVRMKKIYGVN